MGRSKRKHFPLLYRFIRVVVKTAMAVFFQKIELRHGENVPTRGPVIFVANHPNSIMDALVMGLVTKRKVNYIGHAGLFSNKLKDWFLRSCGVIPIYRREDAPEKMDQNMYAFKACYEVLQRGGTIGIFPEGTSDMLRKVKRLKTGAARIAFEAEARNHYQLGVQIIPIGLYFFSRSRFRSRVLMNVGEPIKLKPYFDQYKKDAVAAVHELTDIIQTLLEKLTVNIRHEELDDFVRDVEILYRDQLAVDGYGVQEASESTVKEFILTQQIADCVEFYYERDPDRVQALQDEICLYKRKLKKLHLKDEMLKERITFAALLRRGILTFSKSLVGLPVALYGIINNFIPYFTAEYFGKKFIDDRTKILSALLIGGGFAFILFYSIQITLLGLTYGRIWASVYFVSLPLSGFYALAYLKGLQQEQERISLSFFLFTNRQLFNKMRRERTKLIAKMNSIKEEYIDIVSRSKGDNSKAIKTEKVK